MRMLTRQDHIDPLVLKIQKCGAPGCGPNSVQVIFTRPQGVIKDFDPVWACSSGHCSDYDDIPVLRTPELDPVAWVKENALRVAQNLVIEPCGVHKSEGFDGLLPNGYLWLGEERKLMLCLPRTVVQE